MMKNPDQWFITDLSEEEQEEYNRITDYELRIEEYHE